MKLKDIKKPEAKIEQGGTYVATNFDDDSKKAVIAFAKKIGVDNVISEDKIHTTIIYSRKKAVGLKVTKECYPATAKATKMKIFKTRDDKNALVLLLNAPALVTRHNHIMDTYDTTYDYDEYVPHITLSYDCGDFSISKYDGELPELTIISEYIEDLNLTWAKNATD